MGAQFQTVDKDDYLPSDHAMKDRLIQNLSVHNPCQVYAWGTNNNYTLGTGNQHSRSQPELLDFFRKNNISINQVWYGLLLSKKITIFQNVDTQFKSCSVIIIVIFLKKHFLHRVFYFSLLVKMFVLSSLSVIFYDLLNFNLLAAKCIYYGYNERPVELLRSYLKERVSHNKVLKLGMETLAPLIWDRGVPQGSILRPVLHSMLYVWFLQLCASHGSTERSLHILKFVADSTEPICNSCYHHYFQ